VGAAPVEVHPVFCRQDAFGFYIMHEFNLDLEVFKKMPRAHEKF
jgi:hypothetical protein